MKIAWSGVHERRKAFNILLKALERLPKNESSRIEVKVLGKGPKSDSWLKMVQKSLIKDQINWIGYVPKNEAYTHVLESDIFVITSLHDLTSTVLLEALSLGKPVVCLDHCGFSDVVDETCGIKVKVGWPRQVVEGFAEAIKMLLDEGLRARLSEGAIRKARQYQWCEKKKVLRKIYGKGGNKICASVYACSPYRGSEPGEGWNYLMAIAENNEVWAIVEKEKWKKDIERKIKNEHIDLFDNIHFIYLKKPRARWLRKIWPPSYYWFYRIWQLKAYRKACELDEEINFDVFHQLNMVTFREPGYLWRFNRRFIWGPIGGLGYTNWRLLPLMGFVGVLDFCARNLINWCQAHFLIRPRLAARCAASTGGLIVATRENQREVKKLWGVDSTLLCEIGVEDEE